LEGGSPTPCEAGPSRVLGEVARPADPSPGAPLCDLKRRLTTVADGTYVGAPARGREPIGKNVAGTDFVELALLLYRLADHDGEAGRDAK